MLLRLLIKPRWLLRHLIVIGMCVGFFFLSRWQLHRGELTTGTVQNYGYAVEWLAFGGCVCFAWWRMLQDELHPEGRQRRKDKKAGLAPTTAKQPRSNPWRTPVAPSEDSVLAALAAPVGVPLQASAVWGAGPAPAVAGADAGAGAVAGADEYNPFSAPRQEPILHGFGEMPEALTRGRKPEELTTAMIDPEDEEVVTYNAWLAELNANPGRRR